MTWLANMSGENQLLVFYATLAALHVYSRWPMNENSYGEVRQWDSTRRS